MADGCSFNVDAFATVFKVLHLIAVEFTCSNAYVL